METILGIILVLCFGIILIIITIMEIKDEEKREKERKNFYEYRRYIEDKIEKDRQKEYKSELEVIKANNELENIILQCNKFAIEKENEMYKKLKSWR